MANPSFPVVTLAIWADQPDQTITAQLLDQSAIMATQGKTDDAPEYDRLTPEVDVRRNWIDTSAANEWIAYVQGVGGPLTSITIL